MTDKTGTGDLQMEDILNMNKYQAMKLFKKRATRYKKLIAEIGEEDAYEKMLDKYPEQQKALMGAFIDDNTLAKGFKKSIPLLRQMGFITEIVDISQNGIDGAIEIQRVCPFLLITKEYEIDNPCRIFCEMEQEAARRAFPEMKASLLARQSLGDGVCIFKYERPAQESSQFSKERVTFFTNIVDLIKLIPTLIMALISLVKIRLSNLN